MKSPACLRSFMLNAMLPFVVIARILCYRYNILASVSRSIHLDVLRVSTEYRRFSHTHDGTIFWILCKIIQFGKTYGRYKQTHLFKVLCSWMIYLEQQFMKIGLCKYFVPAFHPRSLIISITQFLLELCIDLIGYMIFARPLCCFELCFHVTKVILERVSGSKIAQNIFVATEKPITNGVPAPIYINLQSPQCSLRDARSVRTYRALES